MLPGMTYTEQDEPTSTEIAPPTDTNLALHVQRAHLQMLSWKVADKSDLPDVQLTDYGWERNMSTQCLPFLGSQLHHRNSWTSSVAAAKRRAKSVVEGVAMDPMECRVLATVSAKEACLQQPTYSTGGGRRRLTTE